MRADYDHRSRYMSRTSPVFHHRVTPSRAAKALVVSAFAFYLINRFVFSFDLLIPWKSLRYHLNDLCGGVLFPFYVDTLCMAIIGRRLINSIPRALLISAICSICWETLAPLFLPYSTGDVLDAVAYALGTLAYQQAITASTSTAPKRHQEGGCEDNLEFRP